MNEMKLSYECQWVILHELDMANCNPGEDNDEAGMDTIIYF